jgi:hypothetical protein
MFGFKRLGTATWLVRCKSCVKYVAVLDSSDATYWWAYTCMPRTKPNNFFCRKPVLRLYHLAASHMYGCQKKGWPLLCESRYGLRIWHREVKTRNFARQLPAPCTMELEDLDSMEDNSASKIKRKQTNLGLDRFPFGSLYLLTRLFCTCTHLHRIKLASSYMTLFRPT